MRVARQAKSKATTRGARERNGNRNQSGKALEFPSATQTSNRSPVRTQERRTFARARMALSLAVRRVAGQPCSQPPALRTIDISSSGASFLYPQRIEPGTPLHLEVTLIEERRRHRAVRMCSDAHVVRAEAAGKSDWHTLAVVFDEIGYERDEHLLARPEMPAALPRS